MALARGEIAEAAGWARARGLALHDQPSYPRERGYLVLARLLLAEQAPTRALGLLERLDGLAAAQGRIGGVIEVRVLQALAARGDEPGALAALAEALTLAAPEGCVRVFLNEGPPLATLLDRLAAAGRWEQAAPGTSVPAAYLRQLRDAFRPAAPLARAAGRRPSATPAPVAGLVEPLSERELEVLELLAAGRSNREIATELVVALDTVKKHVSHVLDKLGAANRTQAVARARELRLLE
jgi:LuxR family transcriptional regulator, maltose regulon positive regulatory protein